jgi:hypothetical protein
LKINKKTERKKLTINPELGGVKGWGCASCQGGSSNVGNNHLDSGSEPHMDLQVNTLKGCGWKTYTCFIPILKNENENL